MVKELAPAPDARGHRFALVAARFHEAHVRRLVDAALDTLRGRGAADGDLEVVWVPGAFEIPVACRWLAASGRYDALTRVLGRGRVVPAVGGVIRPELVVRLRGTP